MELEQLDRQLQGISTSIRKFITRVNGDDYTIGLTKEIKDLLVSLDKNPESKQINNEHFDKLVKICMEVCAKMEKATEYTSEKSNKKLLDKMLDEFQMEKINLTVQLPKGAEIVPTETTQPTEEVKK
jgi:hypothetical protein